MKKEITTQTKLNVTAAKGAETKVEAKKAEVKKVEAKKAEVKTEEKTVEAKKTETTAKAAEDIAKAEKAAKKATATKKAATKTTTAKKTATKKKAEEKETMTNHVFIQTNYSEIVADDVIKKALEAYKAEGNKAKVNNINVYIKPEENAAYYVVNDAVAGRVDIF